MFGKTWIWRRPDDYRPPRSRIAVFVAAPVQSATVASAQGRGVFGAFGVTAGTAPVVPGSAIARSGVGGPSLLAVASISVASAQGQAIASPPTAAPGAVSVSPGPAVGVGVFGAQDASSNTQQVTVASAVGQSRVSAPTLGYIILPGSAVGQGAFGAQSLAPGAVSVAPASAQGQARVGYAGTQEPPPPGTGVGTGTKITMTVQVGIN